MFDVMGDAGLHGEGAKHSRAQLRMMMSLVAFDCETHRLQPGLKAPPLVCASVAEWNPDDGFVGALLDKEQALAAFVALLDDETKIIVGANIAYDCLVMAVHAAGRGLDLMPRIFAAYEAGRIFDVQIAQALDAIARGCLGKDPRTGQKLRDPLTNKMGRYNLAICVDLVLGRKDAKINDRFRNSYALLEHLPIRAWPPEAQQYPVDDAINTLECAMGQLGLVDRPIYEHTWTNGIHCVECGEDWRHAEHPPCKPRQERLRNLHEVPAQVYSHWAMHLGAAWGFVVDQKAVDDLERRVMAGRPERAAPLIASGLLRVEARTGEIKRDMRAIKIRIAQAYGCTGACPSGCNAGKVPSPKTGNPINCKTCGGTGIDIGSAPVPRTDAEEDPGVGTGRDVLDESGDEELAALADFLRDAKIPQTYIPWLRNVDDDGQAHPDVQITLRPNPIVESGRTSYDGVVQLLPRSGGVRECIVARPGYVFCSVDYEGGELVTHAQSCRWIVGYSKLGDALNAGIKPHNAFAATILRLTYDAFQGKFKGGDKTCINTRQAAKPPNFGYPGRMGPVKLALQQRMQGPDTPCENGPTWILDDDGHRVRGYRGLRFCILMDGKTRCGERMITSYYDRPCKPVCADCVDACKRLKDEWLRQWPENVEYFKHVSEIENGDGVVIQHVSRRIRGGLAMTGGNAIANTYFQGLLADLAKSALRRISRECYVDCGTALYGCRVIVFQHDEVIVEMPEAIAHEAAERVGVIMVEEMQKYCPDQKPAAKAEPALMRKWYKGAQAAYANAHGPCKATDPGARLVPWEPKVKAAA